MSDFQQKPKIATAATNQQLLNPAEALAQSLTCDKPTIDSAVNSFLSLIVARTRRLPSLDPNNSMLQQAQDEKKRNCFFIKSNNPRQAALSCAQMLLKTINNWKIPDEDEIINNTMEIEVIIMLWNGLIKSGGKNKPSMMLGRKSLTHVYPLIINKLKATSVEGVDQDEVVSFMDEFGMLLDMATERRSGASIGAKDFNEKNDDSCLL